jgi:N-acetylmuramic acid 6-phosphate etherase
MGLSAVTRASIVTTEHLDPRSIDLDLRASTDVAALLIDSQRQAVDTLTECIVPLADAIDAAVGRLRAGDGRLIYVGAGTSGRLAVQDGVELFPTYSWPMERLGFVLAGGLEAMVGSVEGAEDDASAAQAAMRALQPDQDDVVIGVAASGSTPFTVEAARFARASGALAIGLSNNSTAPLLQAVDHPICLRSGPEIVAGSTRLAAGTLQKIALNTLSTGIMVRLGRVYGGWMVSMRSSNQKLRRRAAAMVAGLCGVTVEMGLQAVEHAEGDVRLASLLALGAGAAAARDALLATDGNLREALARLRGDGLLARDFRV